MFARLSHVWHHDAASSTPATAAKMLVALGPIGTAYVLQQQQQGNDGADDDDEHFAATLAQFVRDNKQAVVDELQKNAVAPATVLAALGVHQSAAAENAGAQKSAPAPRFLLADAWLTTPGGGVISQQSLSSSSQQQLLKDIRDQFCVKSGASAFAAAESLAETLSFAANVYKQPASKLLSLIALVSSSSSSENNTGALLVSVLVRYAVSSMHQGKAAVNNLDLPQFAPCMVRTIVEVLNVLRSCTNNNSNSSSTNDNLQMQFEVDTFLSRVAAPLLSQFGFEFLWRFCSDAVTSASSGTTTISTTVKSAVVNLLHYCQRLSYGERIGLVVKQHQALKQQLLPELPFEQTSKAPAWVPKWWVAAFAELEIALAPFNAEAIASTFRRYRFSAKVVANSKASFAQNEGQGADDDSDAAGGGGEAAAAGGGGGSAANNAKWTRFYSAALNSTRYTNNNINGIPADISLRLQQALTTTTIASLSSSSSSSSTTTAAGAVSSAVADPLMIACFFFTCNASSSFNGRREVLARLSAGLGSSLIQQQGPLWTLAMALVLDSVTAVRAEEEDESPLQAELFSAAVAEMLLERMQTLAALGFLSPVRLDSIVCGFAATASSPYQSSSSSNLDGVQSAAAIFRSCFTKYGIVQRAFAGVLRASWSSVLSAYTNSSNSDFFSSDRAKFALSELVSLATIITTRCSQRVAEQQQQTKSAGGSNEDGADANQLEDEIALAKVVCCVAREWWVAVARYSEELSFSSTTRTTNKSSSSSSSISLLVNEHEVSALCEVLDRCGCGNNGASTQAILAIRAQMQEAKRIFMQRS